MNRRARAFTLIELLVVISIIALLISILLPSLGRVRQSGRDILCKSNMRQIGLITQIYLNDFDETFFERRNWMRWIPLELVQYADELTSPGMTEFIDPTQVGGSTGRPGRPGSGGPVTNDDGETAFWGVPYARHAQISRAIFACPAARDSDPAGAAQPGGNNDGYFMDGHRFSVYGQNNWAGAKPGTGIVRPARPGQRMFGGNGYGGQNWVGNRLSNIRNPSELIFAQDSFESNLEGNGDIPAPGAGGFQQWTHLQTREYFRHMGRGNVLWVDGNVRSVGEFDEWKLRWYGEPPGPARPGRP